MDDNRLGCRIPRVEHKCVLMLEQNTRSALSVFDTNETTSETQISLVIV